MIHDDPQPERKAFAPYNFVPLPEKMVEAQSPLNHDQYHPQPVGYTGWIECELETCSPTYIRGMLTEKQFADFGQAAPDELTDEQKEARSPFFGLEKDNPIIPGSSLRGLIRQIVEIVGYGRMRYISPKPTFTYRAVADKSDDPLREKYKSIFGNNDNQVKAGYLEELKGQWFIRPAQTQKQIEWNKQSNEQYIKVYDEDITDLPGFIRLRDDGYRPQIHVISFERGVEKHKTNWGGNGKSTRCSIVVSAIQDQYKFRGTLVCVGDMNENRRRKISSKQHSKEEGGIRQKHTIVLPVNAQAQRLSIPDQVIQDYLAGLSPFQKNELGDWAKPGWGCLGHGKPVFYIEGDNRKVRYFGHNLNFRIPVNLAGDSRAANPCDFVPSYLIENPNPDLADAIFGWVEGEVNRKVAGPSKQYAGRVFFSDAIFTKAKQGIWFRQHPTTPHILSSPKPTTFQHYLVQDASKGHDPNKKNTLAHYGTPPNETQIRGYKLYWHKGANPDIEATPEERDHKTQVTKISPLNIGCEFRFKIYFENLRPEELGALCWAITLPDNDGKIYRHKLGMGKPLGMGSIAIKLENLHITNIEQRYQTLFDEGSWHLANHVESSKNYIDQFEQFMKEQLDFGQDISFRSLNRIQTLLTMLEWYEKSDSTRYMEIEHSIHGNEYKNRLVLPTPEMVADTLQFEPIWPEKGDTVQGFIRKVGPSGVYLELVGYPIEVVEGFISEEICRKYKLSKLRKGSSLECVITIIQKSEKLVCCRPSPSSLPNLSYKKLSNKSDKSKGKQHKQKR